MTLWRLIVRSVLYHGRALALVAFGIAVAGAVVTGSLVVGDSVRGSVRDAATERLGKIDHALVAPAMIRAQLADELAHDRTVRPRLRRIAPILMDRGAASNPNRGDTAPRITVLGVDDRFRDMFPLGALRGLRDRDAIVNASLARDLGLHIGDPLLVTLPRGSDVDPRALFARRRREDISQTLRVTVTGIVSDTGVGGFALDASTATRRNVFVSRQWLAATTDREGRASAIVMESRDDDSARADGRLSDALAATVALGDLGLRVTRSDAAGCLCVQSTSITLTDRQVQAALDAARDCGLAARRSSAYLATTIRRAGPHGRSIAYAVVAGIEPGEPFRVLSGSSRLTATGLTLNRWAATALGAVPGDHVSLDYLVPQPDGTYATRTLALTVRGIVADATAGADPELAPQVAGVTDARHMGDWHAPFPVDLARVTRADEVYWDRNRAAPKAFVSLDTARSFWRAGDPSGRADWVTSVRVTVALPHGDPGAGVERKFADALRRRLAPSDAGLFFRPVRRLALEASSGTSDFAGLFLGLGMFLVAAALALASTLMRLNADRRAFERGVLLAYGLTERDVRRVALAESLVSALAGASAGCALGVAYAAAIVELLASRWAGAVGSTPIGLHVEPESVAIGALAGVLVGIATSWLTARRLGREPVLRLLRGLPGSAQPAVNAAARPRDLWPALMAVLALAFAAAPAVSRAVSPVAAFFAAAACALIALLAGFGGLLAATGARDASASLLRLAARNMAAQRRHTVLTAGLVAAAAFVLVTAAANQRGFTAVDTHRRDSGTGGFALVATASLPVPVDFGNRAGRHALGFAPGDEDAFRGVTVIPFLLSPGEDVSCLNLAKPQAARVLGVPDAMVERGGFSVRTVGGVLNSPWRLLDKAPADGAIPAFGDSESVEWILHSGLDETYATPGGDGRPVKLRFAGLVEQSIFAGELLVSERNFRRMYPNVLQPRYFLIETPPGRERAVAAALRRNLGEAGLEVRETREVLQAVAAVQNTYLSAFTALGGLGLLLGTAGLAAALLRAAVERRRELALMLATGFARRRLAALLALEHAIPLAAGAVIGAACALLATAPQALSTGVPVGWGETAVLLAAIVACGCALCAWAGGTAVRGGLLAALRGE